MNFIDSDTHRTTVYSISTLFLNSFAGLAKVGRYIVSSVIPLIPVVKASRRGAQSLLGIGGFKELIRSRILGGVRGRAVFFLYFRGRRKFLFPFLLCLAFLFLSLEIRSPLTSTAFPPFFLR